MTRRRAQEGTSVLPRNLHEPEDCRAVSEVLSRVGDKWTVLVVWTLGDGPEALQRIAQGAGLDLSAHADAHATRPRA